MSYNILIVEDSKLISDNIKIALESDGHYVEQSFDVESSIALIASYRFDYLLLDLILPDGEGEHLLPYAKRADLRVIVMTTDRDTFRRDRLFGFGIVDYIIKDRYFDDIITSLRRIMLQVESNTNFTMLVVDDSNFIRNHMELLLHSRGYLILTASNGEEALKIINRFKVDALIADLHMPVMDGFALIGKIRRHKDYHSLPIMVLTGSNDSSLIAKAIKHDVRDLIKKPYVTEEMLLKIDNMMNELRQQQIIDAEHQKVCSYQQAILGSSLSLTLSPELEVLTINPLLVRRLHGDISSESPGVGKIFQDLIKNPNLEILRYIKRLSKKNSENPALYSGVFEFLTDDNTPCYISGTFSAVHTFPDELELLFIGFDVTQIHLTQQQLEEQVQDYIEINHSQQQMMFYQAKMASMGEMIGNIAHQWRQPLNLLGLLIQNLLFAKQADEVDNVYIENMVSRSMDQIKFMSQTIDDFKHFFQPNKSKKRFDIIDAIDKTLIIVGGMLQNSGIELLQENTVRNLFFVEGYQSELQQVLLSLISNSKDAVLDAPSNGKKVITIAVRQDGDWIVIDVSDSGGGIREEIMERIFEPYFTTKEGGDGTGVGLYMSKLIIEKSMGGKLDVINKNDGACFSIKLFSDIARSENES